MNMSEFYSEFLFRYQTDAAPLKISQLDKGTRLDEHQF